MHGVQQKTVFNVDWWSLTITRSASLGQYRCAPLVYSLEENTYIPYKKSNQQISKTIFYLFGWPKAQRSLLQRGSDKTGLDGSHRRRPEELFEGSCGISPESPAGILSDVSEMMSI